MEVARHAVLHGQVAGLQQVHRFCDYVENVWPNSTNTVPGPEGVGLSGGQRQRLGLARALLGQPALLVLDEPNANLDTAGETGLRHALEALKAAGTTIVLVTHRTTVLEMVDRMMFVRNGRLEVFAKPDDVYRHIKENVVPEMQAA